MGLPQHPYRWRVARAALLRVEGDTDAALALLDEAERVYDGDFSPEVHPVASARARLWVSTGRHADALAWARERGLTAEDDAVYLREDEHITLARALLAQAVADGNRSAAMQASSLVGRLLEAAEAGGRGRSVVELLVLRALACQARATSTARSPRWTARWRSPSPRATSACSSTRGPPWPRSSPAAARRSPASYASRLLGAFDDRPALPARRQPLVEPLSERELEVLRLLASDLDGPEIAAELFISLNTLRTHTRNIYAKLGVSSRRAAVTRAAELGLLSRDR